MSTSVSELRPKEERLQFGQWGKLQVSGPAPSQRFSHSTVVVNDVLYVFGGSSYGDREDTIYHNDMYRLKLIGALLWDNVDQKGDVPSPREGAILVAVKEGLYLYGGTDREGATSCAQGLYHFDIETDTWSKHTTSGPPPQALSMSGIISDDKLVTFGGVLSGKGCNSVNILDINTFEWSAITTHGTTQPKARCDHACTVSRQNMFVCAGTGSEDLWFNDLHRLNLDTLEWQEVEQKGYPPSPRDYATLVAIRDWYLVLYGGSSAMGGKEEVFSDLHYIDITTANSEWYSVGIGGGDHQLPPARYSHSMVVCNNKLFVFGGQDNEVVYNDMWTIDFTLPLEQFHPSTVPRHSYVTSVPVPAPRKVVQPSTPISVKPRDFDDLRSTYLARINDMFDTLGEKFNQLDKATETLAAERAAFELEKREHIELYEKQQSELSAMMERHRTQNEEWIERMRIENDTQRKEIAQEKAMLEKAQAELATDRQAFTEKSRKLDAIMKQVQGLQEP